MTNQTTEHSRLAGISLSQSAIDIDRAQSIINILREHPLVREAFELLQEKLPDGLYYHNLEHTNDVFENSIKLGLADGLDHNDITLLAIAAAWHDTGFIVKSAQNEPIAADFVKEAMTRHGSFGEKEIEDVCQAILETQIQFNITNKTLYQKCSGRLSAWLLDADLNNFGQKDFMLKSMRVYSEMRANEVRSLSDIDDKAGIDYISTTIRLVARHNWHSDAARQLFYQQEKENLAGLALLLAELTNGTETGKQQAWSAMFSKNS